MVGLVSAAYGRTAPVGSDSAIDGDPISDPLASPMERRKIYLRLHSLAELILIEDTTQVAALAWHSSQRCGPPFMEGHMVCS